MQISFPFERKFFSLCGNCMKCGCNPYSTINIYVAENLMEIRNILTFTFILFIWTRQNLTVTIATVFNLVYANFHFHIWTGCNMHNLNRSVAYTFRYNGIYLAQQDRFLSRRRFDIKQVSLVIQFTYLTWNVYPLVAVTSLWITSNYGNHTKLTFCC